MKTHMNLQTRDLDKSVGFYRTLLNAKPVKHYEDYALFITEDPGLELALDSDPNVKLGESAHYGIVVNSTAGVEDAISRLQAEGLVTSVQREDVCCYAKQDKVWATDPDGRQWEIYTVLEESDVRDTGDTNCCRETHGGQFVL